MIRGAQKNIREVRLIVIISCVTKVKDKEVRVLLRIMIPISNLTKRLLFCYQIAKCLSIQVRKMLDRIAIVIAKVRVKLVQKRNYLYLLIMICMRLKTLSSSLKTSFPKMLITLLTIVITALTQLPLTQKQSQPNRNLN